MTRKHFQILAENLKAERPSPNWSGNKLTQWNLDVKAVAKACAVSNPGFKFDRFYTACGELFER